MLDDVDQGAWRERGLSDGDVQVASGLSSILLRAYGIELGLKDILATRMQRPTSGHDLVRLWGRLSDEWRTKVAEACGVPAEDIRGTLQRYKNTAVNARYGKSFGGVTGHPPDRDRMMRDAQILQKLTNTLGGMAHPSITGEIVEPGEPAG